MLRSAIKSTQQWLIRSEIVLESEKTPNLSEIANILFLLDLILQKWNKAFHGDKRIKMI